MTGKNTEAVWYPVKFNLCEVVQSIPQKCTVVKLESYFSKMLDSPTFKIITLLCIVALLKLECVQYWLLLIL